ncbi:MAG TPA: zinc ribbon domain-containing protein [Blastocatellia bacterium]|nr:zinc ribbon domain-containing protein [Blastocatellia bacterium]
MLILFGLGMPELMMLLILAAVVIAVVLSRDSKNHKDCPHCAEKIKLAARVCRFCGRDVVSA